MRVGGDGDVEMVGRGNNKFWNEMHDGLSGTRDAWSVHGAEPKNSRMGVILTTRVCGNSPMSCW